MNSCPSGARPGPKARGGGFASYMLYKNNGGGVESKFRLPGQNLGSEIHIVRSIEASFKGFPLYFLGFVGLFGLSLDRFLNMDLERTYYNTILLPITGLIGTVFGTYLTYAEAFIIHEWCPFCLIAFGLTLGATFFALKEYGSTLKEFLGGNNGI